MLKNGCFAVFKFYYGHIDFFFFKGKLARCMGISMVLRERGPDLISPEIFPLLWVTFKYAAHAPPSLGSLVP